VFVVPTVALLSYVLYWHASSALVGQGDLSFNQTAALKKAYLTGFAVLLLIFAIVSWWLVLARNSRLVAQEESRKQTQLLWHEIESHGLTDQKLQQAKAQADQANQAKSRYVSTLSHEFRTPLNGIMGYAQLLADDPLLPSHRRQAVQVIRRGADHLLSLIEGTLDIAHIESGKISLRPQLLRMRDLMDDIAELIEPQAASKGLAFYSSISTRWPQVIKADPQRLRQIIFNLLGNAVKFTSSGQVAIRLDYHRQMASIEVSDTGPGIAPEELQKIFEPFSRGTAAGQGTGLGLTIARMLTELMGGSIEVDSQANHGTRFVVKLFLPEQPADSLPDKQVQNKPVGWSDQQGRTALNILIVDNEETDRDLLSGWLTLPGFQLVLASSGEQAVERIKQGFSPDVVLMDLAMPKMDGWQTLQALKQLPNWKAQCAVAIVSANAFEKTQMSISGAPFGLDEQDFIVKPVRRTELFEWLAGAAGLSWHDQPVASSQASAGLEQAALEYQKLPTANELQGLLAAASIGYARGVFQQLDHLQSLDPAYSPVTQRLRQWAQRFEFDAIVKELKRS
jgi:signal transduction histidine kinase/FixJ family two-component response regulator